MLEPYQCHNKLTQVNRLQQVHISFLQVQVFTTFVVGINRVQLCRCHTDSN